MEIGHPFTWAPAAFMDTREQTDILCPKRVSGWICYIHPKRRYFTAAAEVNGYVIRESFKIIPKEG